MPTATGQLQPGDPGYSAPGGLIQAAGGQPTGGTLTSTATQIGAPTASPVNTYTAAQAAPVNATSTGYTPTGVVVADDQTVADNINKLISQDSPLMQQATTRARQDANSRGLLNSSLAVGAGQNAVIAQALPIAQQDAATRFAANQQTVQAQNAASQFGANAGNAASLNNSQVGTSVSTTNAGAANAALNQGASAANTQALSYLDANTRLQLGQLSTNTQTYLGNLDAQNRQLLQTNSNASSMFSDTVKNIAAIAADQTMTPDAKQAATQSQLNLLNQGLQTTAGIAGTPSAALQSLNLGQYFGNASLIDQGQTQQNFNAQAYLQQNPDVAASGMNPYQHWLTYGKNEGRPFPYVNPPAQ